MQSQLRIGVELDRGEAHVIIVMKPNEASLLCGVVPCEVVPYGACCVGWYTM